MRLYRGFAALVIALAFAGSACAQGWPTKPIRMIVPYTPGGYTDFMARAVGQKLSEALGQPIIFENKPGANAIIGTDVVAKAPPDGYTIGTVIAAHAVNATLNPKLPYDTLKDFSYVSLMSVAPLLMIAHPSLPANNMKELIALAKAKPGSLNYGSSGIGAPLHLTMEIMKHSAGIDIVHVPFRGDAPLNTALIAGEVHLAVVPFATAKPHVEAGRLRALAIPGAKRSPALPQVPTIAESGLPGFESSSWQGWFVPANTPSEIVALIQREAAKALNAPDVRERLEATANEVVASTPEAFAPVFKNDLAKFAKVVKDAKIPLQD